MSEAFDLEKDFCFAVYTTSLIKVLRENAQKDLNRKVYSEFVNALAKKDMPYDLDKDSGLVKTTLGFYKLFRSQNAIQEIRIFKNMNIPYACWRAGQLAFMALEVANSYYKPGFYGLRMPGKSEAMDLSVIKINATLGGNKVERILGVLPMKYSTGKPVASTAREIKEFKDEICAELALNNPAKGNKIDYRITRAFAWHLKHGMQNGFNKGETPKGLEAKVIDSGNVPLHSSQQT